MSPVLSNAESKAFYDRFGARQDRQSFYEDRALDDLVAHADLATAKHVFEFGCGTGRLAARLFEECLGPRARYDSVDISPTMVGLAKTRLARWSDRAQVLRSDGSVRLEAPDGAYDRFVSAYVLDSERRRHHPSDRRSPPRAWHGGTPLPRQPHLGRHSFLKGGVLGLAAVLRRPAGLGRRLPADSPGRFPAEGLLGVAPSPQAPQLWDHIGSCDRPATASTKPVADRCRMGVNARANSLQE